MWRHIVLPSLGLAIAGMGCGQNSLPEPATPEPVVIVTPADDAPEEPGTPPPEATAVYETALQGKWRHTLPSENEQERIVLLEYVRDQDGHERFEFLQHPWQQQPVFVEQKKSGRETELRFELPVEGDATTEKPDTVRYVLNEVGETWTGKLFESWSDIAYDVVLTRSK